MYLVRFTKQAAKDAEKLKAAGLDAKAKRLVGIVRKDPFQTPPAYEGLVGNLTGLYSRRISLKHRFVYEVIPGEIREGDTAYDGIVKVVRMWSHYDHLR